MFDDIEHIHCRTNETGNCRIAVFSYMGERYNFFSWMGNEPQHMACTILGPRPFLDTEILEGL